MNKSAPLAIQDVSAAHKGGGKSKAIKGTGDKGKADKGKGTKGKGTGKTEYVISTGSRFDDLMASAGVLQRLHKRNQNTPGFCYNFQSRSAKTPTARGFTLAQDATQPTFPTPIAFALKQPDISPKL